MARREVAADAGCLRPRRAGVAAAGVEPGRLRVLPNFVELPEGSEPAAQGAPFGEPNRSSILYVGPADPHKGRQVLLEAFSGLRSRGVNLVLAGGDGSLRAPFVSDLGARPEEALAGLYRDALFVVVPSVWPDPCPTVALEAMAWGRPVIASATGGLTEIVADGVTGLLVAPKDSAALVRAMESLLDIEGCGSGSGGPRAGRDFASPPTPCCPSWKRSTRRRADLAGRRPDAPRGPPARGGLRRRPPRRALLPGRARGGRRRLRRTR